jgi:hypothetical protein
MKPAIVLGLALLALAPLRAEPDERVERFARGLSEAKANLQTPEGHEYDRSLSAFLRRQNASVLGGCFKSVQNPDKNSFEMVFQLAAGGEVRDARVWPETNIGVCLRDGLKALKFPAPPRDAYWAHSRVSLAP